MGENRVRLFLRCIGSAAVITLSPVGAFATENAQCVAHIEKVIADGSTPAKATLLPSELIARVGLHFPPHKA